MKNLFNKWNDMSERVRSGEREREREREREIFIFVFHRLTIITQ